MKVHKGFILRCNIILNHKARVIIHDFADFNLNANHF